jgi:hypothetical protein
VRDPPCLFSIQSVDIDIPGRNPNGKFPMRQTRALSAFATAKILENSGQCSVLSFKLKADD